jgi:AsmA-like C-terminal region
VARTEGGQPGHVTFAARPAGTESQLTLTSDDAGDMLRTIDAYADASGGRLKFTGTGRLGVAGFPLAGTVKVDRFTLTRSPMVAKIAALGSISPIVDALRGDGIPFSQLTASLTHRAGVIVISECTLTGAAVAMALRGTVDRMKDDLSLTGTLVPSYTALSRLTKEVPALGPEPTGATSDGVRSVDFEVSGSLGDPYVTVKPTSAAASGSRREGRRSGRSRGGSELRPEEEQKPREGRRSGRSRGRSELRPEEEQKPKPKPKPRRRPRPASPASQEPKAQ